MRCAGHVPRRLALVSFVSSCYLLAGCDQMSTDVPTDEPPWPDYARVCVDPRTHDRVEDELCQGAPEDFTTPPGLRDDSDVIAVPGGGYGWYYYGADRGLTAPRVGGRVTGGGFTTPKLATGGRVATGMVPKAGGAIVRGGLGVSGGGKSGGG